jgi:DNA-directed RNA polymerase subunit RPC12/RpoP
MSEIKFSCPHCEQHIQCETAYQGTEINCPSCGYRFVVPQGAEQSPARMAPAPALSLAGRSENDRPSSWGSQADTTEEEPNNGSKESTYEMFTALASDVKSLPEFQRPKPSRLQGVRGFFARAIYALGLMFREKEIIVFSLLQCSAIGIAYYVWVQVLGWIPEETWRNASESDGVSTTDILVGVWSILCVGLAAFPLGILSGCMGAVHFLHQQGQDSSIARCLQIILPQSGRLWVFHWIDGMITCKQIVERLPKKGEKRRSAADRALSEALYYAWKLGTIGILPSLVLGKDLISACKDSLGLVKGRFLDVSLLRLGYSAVCWVVGVLTCVGTVYLFYKTGFFHETMNQAGGVQIYDFFVFAGVPLLVAVAIIQVFIRPIFIIAVCDIYSELLRDRGQIAELRPGPGRGMAAMVAFALIAVIVAVGGLFLKPLLQQEVPDSIARLEARALPFDGVDDMLEVSSIPWHFFEQFTIEAWVKDWQGALLSQVGAPDPQNKLQLSLGMTAPLEGTATVKYGWTDGAGRQVESVVAQDFPDEWLHVALVYDGNEHALYLNGQPRGRSAVPPPAQLSRPLAVGKAADGSFATGLLRSIRVSSSARYANDFSPEKVWANDEHTVLLLDSARRDGALLEDLSRERRDAAIQGMPSSP